jgi:hypothetical protein
MATTFIGITVVEPSHHAAVVLRRRKSLIELYDWSCNMDSQRQALEYLAAVAGKSGVIAVHDPGPDMGGELMKRLWRVLDYRQSFELSRRMRTRSLVRVQPLEVARALCGEGDALPLAALERAGGLFPQADFGPLVRAVKRAGMGAMADCPARRLVSAGLGAYAALWCWWHGPAGYDVLGQSNDSYRLAPRMMDLEPDPDRTII